MIFPNEQDFALLLFQVFTLLSLALGLGELFRRFGQPTVIGEIFAGVLLGPSVLGTLSPQIASALFQGAQTQLLGSLAWLGSVFLLLVAGTEINLTTLIAGRRTVGFTSLLGIALPFGLGFVFALNLPESYLVDPARRTLFSLFFATALSISAIPVVAKTLMDLKLLRTGVGQTIIGSAVVNDLAGWIFFAVILSQIGGNAMGHRSVLGMAALTLVFAGTCLTLGKSLVGRILSFFHALNFHSEATLGFAVLITFLCAAFTQWIGMHAIFGAFLAGVMLGQTGEIINDARELLRQMVFYIFAPIFFATMGLRANFVTHFDPVLVSGVLLIACAGKILGGAFGAMIGGMKRHEAFAVGFGLNARGAMEIILAFLALEHGLIAEKVFVALVITAIVTSIMSGPLIQWMMKSKSGARQLAA